MDKLSLRKYHRSSSVVDRNVNSLRKLAKSKSLPIGNTSLTPDGIVKTEKSFVEFYINEEPLSKLLNNFYATQGSILDNWIGILGWSVNKKSDIVKVKRLLGKNISDKEIREMYPAEWSDIEFQHYLAKEREELSDPECGGITVQINKTDDSFVWIFGDKDKHLKFEFDKYQYFDLFDKYLRKLKKED